MDFLLYYKEEEQKYYTFLVINLCFMFALAMYLLNNLKSLLKVAKECVKIVQKPH